MERSPSPTTTTSPPQPHTFHSPLNSNALVTITVKPPQSKTGTDIDTETETKAQTDLSLDFCASILAKIHAFLAANFSNFDILPQSTSDYEGKDIAQKLRIKFIDKADSQLLEEKISLQPYIDSIDIKVDYDALTHPGNIYIRGLMPEINTQDLYKLFEPFGQITSCKIVTDDYGRSRGYGFVNFVDGDSADEAISKLNGLLVNGSKLYLNHHIAKKERIERLDFEKAHFTNLYVKNLPEDFTEEKLRSLFEKYGEINSLFLPEVSTGATTNNSIDQSVESSSESINSSHNKRFGFVNFKNHDSALKALEELDNKELEPTYILSVSRAQRRDERNKSISPQPIPPIFSPSGITSPQSIGALMHSPPSTISSTPLNVPPPSNANGGTGPPLHLAASPNHQYPAMSTSAPAPPLPGLSGQTSQMPLFPMPGPMHQESNLYVKNLSANIDDDALYSAFAPFGIIVSAKIMTMEDGTPRGFGFVCYKTSQEASRALFSMDGTVLDGQIIHVSFAQKNNRRSKSLQHGLSNANRMGYPRQQGQQSISRPGSSSSASSGYYYPNTAASPFFYQPLPPPPHHQNMAPGAAPGSNNAEYMYYPAPVAPRPPQYGNMMNGNNNGGGFIPYNNGGGVIRGYSPNGHNGQSTRAKNSKKGYSQSNADDGSHEQKLLDLSLNINESLTDEEKQAKILEKLIIPELKKLNHYDGDNNENDKVIHEKALDFLNGLMSKYNENAENRWLDVINDWGNDEALMISQLKMLQL